MEKNKRKKKNPTQLKKVVLKFSKAQLEVAKLCPDSRTNTLFNTHLKLYLSAKIARGVLRQVTFILPR